LSSSAGSPTLSAKSARLPRRSAGELEGVVDRLVAIVTSAPDGINAERLRAALQVERKELPKPISLALSAGRIHKSGNKRATLYFGAASVARANAAMVDEQPRTK